jgi:RNA polymerase sigma-70 factor, ECF subfamily
MAPDDNANAKTRGLSQFSSDENGTVPFGRLSIEQLVAEHQHAVYGYALRLTAAPADAEDLSQEAFLVAHQRLDQLRRPEAARSWLLAIVRNCYLETLRRARPVPASGISLDLDAVPEESLLLEMPNGERIEPARLDEAISQLSPEYRLVLAMFYFEDRQYREIAEELRLPIGTVMSRLARAKQRLRAKLFDVEKVAP